MNLAIDVMRRKKPVVGMDILDRVENSVMAVDDGLILTEQQRLLECAIQDLPERQRVALNLCFYEGLSNLEAAQVLGVGVKALESLLMRAKAGIRQSLDSRGVLEKEGEA